MLKQNMIKLERRNLCAAAHNEILDPAGKLDSTVFTHLRKISGLKEPVDEDGTCQVGFVKIAVHDEGRAKLKLVNLVDRQLATLIIGDAKLHLRSGMADRTGEFHLILRPKKEVRAARFGQSIYVDYANLRNEHL